MIIILSVLNVKIQTNFYTFSDTTTGNQNTCHDFNNILSLPGKYLQVNNGRLVNVNLEYPNIIQQL